MGLVQEEVSNAARVLGRAGLNARWSGTTASERKEFARQLAMRRWRGNKRSNSASRFDSDAQTEAGNAAE